MRSSPPLRSLLTAVLLAGGLLVGCDRAALAQAFDGQSAAPIASNTTVDAAIAEASLRFGVPEPWIRAVIRVESAGRLHAISSAGAIGLMQVMPSTYAVLRRRYELGSDPFDVRDNILAGTAYLREMHDRYGRTGMLAAYNAGPGRWEEHITQARPLPLETVAYVARLAPMIGAYGLPRQGGVQVASASGAPPQVLFVSRRDSAAVETAASSGQVAAAIPAPGMPAESVFVHRASAVHQHADDGPSPSSTALPDSIFAPVGGSNGDQ